MPIQQMKIKKEEKMCFFVWKKAGLISFQLQKQTLSYKLKNDLKLKRETKTKISFLQLRKPLSSLSIGGGANGASMPKKVITKNNKFEVII